MRRELVPRFWNWPSLPDEDDWLARTDRGSGLQVSETNTHVVVEAHVPGLDANDVEVTYRKGVLSIRGDKKETEEDKQKKFYRQSQRSFSYQVAVPGNVDEEAEPDATYRNGVMTVKFPKRKEEAPKRLKVKRA